MTSCLLSCMLSLSEHGSTLDVFRAYCFPHETGGFGRVGEGGLVPSKYSL